MNFLNKTINISRPKYVEAYILFLLVYIFTLVYLYQTNQLFPPLLLIPQLFVFSIYFFKPTRIILATIDRYSNEKTGDTNYHFILSIILVHIVAPFFMCYALDNEQWGTIATFTCAIIVINIGLLVFLIHQCPTKILEYNFTDCPVLKSMAKYLLDIEYASNIEFTDIKIKIYCFHVVNHYSAGGFTHQQKIPQTLSYCYTPNEFMKLAISKGYNLHDG